MSVCLADRRSPYVYLDSGNPRLDSLIIRINQKLIHDKFDDVGRLSLYMYVKGTSQCHQQGRMARYLSNAVPFQTDTSHITVIEALCEANYQYPSDMLFSPIAISTNSNRRGLRILKESYQLILPIYTIRRLNDKSSNKVYVLPFSDQGLELYTFAASDTIGPLIRIDFQPRNEHHTLINGFVLADSTTYLISQLHADDGRIDFGRMDFTLYFGKDHKTGRHLPLSSDFTLSYRYGKTESSNHYTCLYNFRDYASMDQLDLRHNSLDLTDLYQEDPLRELNFDTIRPIALTPEEDSLLNSRNYNTATRRTRSLFSRLPDRLFGSTAINAFGTRLRIDGPLNPAAIGYDHRDGLSLRERIRWSHRMDNQQSLYLRSDIGWCFGAKELRYRINFEWMHHPEHRSGLSLSLRNRNSGFPAKFKDVINETLKNEDSLHVDFSQLAIDYFHQQFIRLEHSHELANGLMLYGGANYTYRSIVRRGQYAIPEDRFNELVHKHYSDFSPFIRLQWTPRQYYRMEGREKVYLASHYPTIEMELVRSVPGVFNSSSNYGRMEIDVQQRINFNDVHSLSYHVSGGRFIHQKGEYFINWNYFNHSQFPSLWEDHVGGVFNLLDNHWYYSSPSYYQSHLMYETPFFLLHRSPLLSKYVINERVYLSSLWAEGKNTYTEFGYGMGNNYFNIGVFGGFIGMFQDFEIGFKASLEIDSHL